MSPILVLFIVDGVSKIFLALASLLLIKYLPVTDFAQFSIVFTVSMMAYQIISGVIERLYISDYDNYKHEGGGSSLALMCVVGVVISIYIYFYVDLCYAIFTFALIVVCTKYQMQRIKKQKEERFFTYAVVDMLRNLVWLVLLYLNFKVFFVLEYIGNVEYALGTFALLAIVSNVLLHLFSKKTSLKAHSESIHSPRFLCSAKYFISRKDVIAYSILGGVIPYYPFIIATLMRDESLIATYGAAMRYQAIFSMAILAVNTVVIARFCNNKEIINQHSVSFYKILPVVMFFLAVAIFAVYWAIPYVDGGKYPNLQNAFVILSICSAVSLVSTVAVNKLLAFNNYSAMLKSVLSGFVVMVVITPLFIYVNNEIGPLLSMLTGYSLITLLLIIKASKEKTSESVAG